MMQLFMFFSWRSYHRVDIVVLVVLVFFVLNQEAKETIYKHGKACIHANEMPSAANVPSKLLLNVEADRSEFFRQILTHLRDDDIGALCCSDQ